MLGAGGTASFGRFFRLERPRAFWELLPLLPLPAILSRSCALSLSPAGVRESVLGFFFFGLLDSELLVLAFEDAESDGEMSEEASQWRRDMMSWPSGGS